MKVHKGVYWEALSARYTTLSRQIKVILPKDGPIRKDDEGKVHISQAIYVESNLSVIYFAVPLETSLAFTYRNDADMPPSHIRMKMAVYVKRRGPNSAGYSSYVLKGLE